MAKSSGTWGSILTGAIAVVVPTPYSLGFLACGAFLAVRSLWKEAGVGRIAPTVVLAAIVVAAQYAPFKTIEWEEARRITLPKLTMTIAELRRPHDFDLTPSYRRSYFMVHPPEVLDDQVIHFFSHELTVAEFIRAIEEQAPLRHRFLICGNAGSSILCGPLATMGLGFFPSEP